MAEKPTRSHRIAERERNVCTRAAREGEGVKEKIQYVPAGGSDFAYCHCNFLAGCSFRGVSHHRGITYRWLFVRMSPRVIICLVTRPVTAYLASLFLSRCFLFVLASLASYVLLSLPVVLFISRKQLIIRVKCSTDLIRI